MDDQTSNSYGDGMIVVDGPGIDLPQIPSTSDEKERGRCRLKVILTRVHYAGNDVGSTWRYYIAVDDCGGWASDVRVVPWQTADAVNRVICDTEIDHECGQDRLLSFYIRARELDWYIFDDIGDQITAMTLPCQEKATQRQVIVLVPVPEYPTSIWRKLFRKRARVALLSFFFEVSAQCVT